MKATKLFFVLFTAFVFSWFSFLPRKHEINESHEIIFRAFRFFRVFVVLFLLQRLKYDV